MQPTVAQQFYPFAETIATEKERSLEEKKTKRKTIEMPESGEEKMLTVRIWIERVWRRKNVWKKTGMRNWNSMIHDSQAARAAREEGEIDGNEKVLEIVYCLLSDRCSVLSSVLSLHLRLRFIHCFPK